MPRPRSKRRSGVIGARQGCLLLVAFAIFERRELGNGFGMLL
jgi:hypothetical protein